MKSKINLGLDNFILSYYKTEFDCIKSYFQKLSDSVQSEKDRLQSLADFLKSKGADDDYIADSLDDDSFTVNFFETNTYNFAIVFLYSECEKLLKQDYRILTYKNAKKMFKFDILKDLYKEEEIDISSFANFSKINELRLLNNSIKHDGYPSDELYKINHVRWKKDKKIELTYFEIETFLDETEKFFDDLVPMIKSKNEEKILKEDLDLIEKLCKENLSSKPNNIQQEINKVLSKLQKFK